MPFTKGHKLYKGIEKGWFKKGQISPNKGKQLSEDIKKRITQEE